MKTTRRIGFLLLAMVLVGSTLSAGAASAEHEENPHNNGSSNEAESLGLLRFFPTVVQPHLHKLHIKIRIHLNSATNKAFDFANIIGAALDSIMKSSNTHLRNALDAHKNFLTSSMKHLHIILRPLHHFGHSRVIHRPSYVPHECFNDAIHTCHIAMINQDSYRTRVCLMDHIQAFPTTCQQKLSEATGYLESCHGHLPAECAGASMIDEASYQKCVLSHKSSWHATAPAKCLTAMENLEGELNHPCEEEDAMLHGMKDDGGAPCAHDDEGEMLEHPGAAPPSTTNHMAMETSTATPGLLALRNSVEHRLSSTFKPRYVASAPKVALNDDVSSGVPVDNHRLVTFSLLGGVVLIAALAGLLVVVRRRRYRTKDEYHPILTEDDMRSQAFLA